MSCFRLGEVQEYRNRNDVGSMTATELSHRLEQDKYNVLSKGFPSKADRIDGGGLFVKCRRRTRTL